MSAVPQLRPRRVRRRRRHGGALLAALAYGVAAFAVYQLVVPALGRDTEPATGVEEAVASAPPLRASCLRCARWHGASSRASTRFAPTAPRGGQPSSGGSTAARSRSSS